MSKPSPSLPSFVVEIMPDKRALAQLACLNKQFKNLARTNKACYDTASLIQYLKNVCKENNLNDISITFPLKMSPLEKKVEDATHRGITFHIGQDKVEMNILIMYHYDVQPSENVTNTLGTMRTKLLTEFTGKLDEGESMSTKDVETIQSIIEKYGGEINRVYISHNGLNDATITIIKEVVKDAVNEWCVFKKNVGGSKKNHKKVVKGKTPSSPSAKAKSTTPSSPSAKAKSTTPSSPSAKAKSTTPSSPSAKAKKAAKKVK